jgi:hypothetical protein
MVELPLEMEPVVEGKVRVDEAPMERQRLGASERTRGLEVRLGKAVRLARLISSLDTIGLLPEWEGLSRKTLLSAGD